jgi:hypothetical protein
MLEYTVFMHSLRHSMGLGGCMRCTESWSDAYGLTNGYKWWDSQSDNYRGHLLLVDRFLTIKTPWRNQRTVLKLNTVYQSDYTHSMTFNCQVLKSQYCQHAAYTYRWILPGPPTDQFWLTLKLWSVLAHSKVILNLLFNFRNWHTILFNYK